jgi:hypothetical protein
VAPELFVSILREGERFCDVGFQSFNLAGLQRCTGCDTATPAPASLVSCTSKLAPMENLESCSCSCSKFRPQAGLEAAFPSPESKTGDARRELCHCPRFGALASTGVCVVAFRSVGPDTNHAAERERRQLTAQAVGWAGANEQGRAKETTLAQAKGAAMRARIVAVCVSLILAGFLTFDRSDARAGELTANPDYKVLDPIRHGNLTIFPVVAAKTYPTSEFLTLDEGLRSGEVIVTEAGSVQGLVRRHNRPLPHADGAAVNRLVLVNNSARPLLLLAGEIVTGGKRDRVIGKDRIVPPESDPVDLNVFCVEPGRWVASSDRFGASETMYGAYAAKGAGNGSVTPPMAMMAQPSVRSKAMGDKNQQEVWDAVNAQKQQMTVAMNDSAPAVAGVIGQTSSYAKVNENSEVKKRVDAIAKPIEQSYQSLIHQLRDRNAVGVVVAVNGRIIWADVFASTDLLVKYWPKLVRSYASEAVVTRAKEVDVTVAQARTFLADREGRREMIESETGIYRHTEVTGDGFKAFSLTSLLPKTGFDVHVAKMAE